LGVRGARFRFSFFSGTTLLGLSVAPVVAGGGVVLVGLLVLLLVPLSLLALAASGSG
jgi:hypothetical protein